MNQPFLRPCPLWAERLAATHPDDLSPTECRELKYHMASCATCTAILAEYDAIGRELGQLPIVEARPGLPPALLRLWSVQEKHPLVASAITSEEPGAVSSAPQRVAASRTRHARALIQTAAAVLVIGALLGGFLVVFALRHTGPTSPGPISAAKSWKLVASPNPGVMENSLNGVAVVSANDVWAVGYSSDSASNSNNYRRQALIEHWNGKQWSIVPGPNLAPNSYGLNGIATVSASDVWAVGYNGADALIEHWNGVQWSVINGPGPGSNLNILNGVSVVSSDDIWAVGYSSSSTLTYTTSGGTTLHYTREQTLIEHWNGSQWSIVPSPNPGSLQNSLSAIAAVSANDIWAVGYSSNYIPLYTINYQELVEHWNGKQWSVIQTPLGSNILSSIAVVSASNIWAVGNTIGVNGSASQALIEHWNGSKWSIIQSADNPASYRNFLVGLVAVSADDIWAVGGAPQTYPQQGQLVIEHWNGKQWSIVTSPNPGHYNNYLTAMARDPHSNRIWAVGYSGEGYSPSSTITEVWGN